MLKKTEKVSRPKARPRRRTTARARAAVSNATRPVSTKSAPAQPHPTSDVRPPAPTPDAGLPVSASENSSRAASRRPSLVVRIDRLDGEIVYATAMQFLEHATQDEATGQGGPRRRRSVDQIAAWLVSTYPSALGLRLARNSDAEKRAA